MSKQLSACLIANLAFYRRNKLLLLIAAVLVLVWGMSTLPSLFMFSNRQKFDMILGLLLNTTWFVNIFVAALGMLNISYSLNQHCYKMVVTKPCRSETWLFANYLSAMMVAVVFHLLLFAVGSILFLVWKIPYQWGLLFVVADGVARATILFSILTLLTALINPFIAILAMLVLNERTFYWLNLWTTAAVRNASGSFHRALLLLQNYILYGIYIILPSYTPFADKTEKIYNSLKLHATDMRYLAGIMLYAIVISAMCFFITDASLRQRRLT